MYSCLIWAPSSLLLSTVIERDVTTADELG